MMNMMNLNLRKTMLNSAIVAVCFLYAGSVYMSQFYRLMELCDGKTLDIITSCLYYALQALGILLFVVCFKAKPGIVGRRRFFVGTLLTGLPFMIIAQLAGNTALIIASSCIFHVHVGLYFGYYLSLFAEHVPEKHSAFAFACAYAVGSLGTYILSLFDSGNFLTSKGITLIYLLFAAITILLVHYGESILPETESGKDESLSAIPLKLLMAIITVMMLISVIGSRLYYSLPQAANVNWNLIRAFYAVGLIITGAVMDYRRWIGEILAATSLLYPLIALALIGEGLNNTAALVFSYLFRGCLSVYYVISFTDIASSCRKRIYIASIGLFISRITEAVLTLILMMFEIPNLAQILTMAFFMIPLIVLIIIKQKKQAKAVAEPISGQKRNALFSEKYNLTARESEILSLLAEGLTDDEIAERIYVSRNTIRFHVSNILKKTNTTSRVEAVRSLQKYG